MSLQINKRQKLNNYILISQVFFYLLLSILFLRQSGIAVDFFMLKISSISAFSLFLMLIPLVPTLNIELFNNSLFWDCVLCCIYLFLACILLVKEQNDLFYVALLMPAVVLPLKHGIKTSLPTGIISAICLLLIERYHNCTNVDALFMLAGIIFLLSWLLGSMTETNNQVTSELERIAIQDSLTELYNHRQFHNILDKKIEESIKNNEDLSLLIMDIDNFKYYNDTFGHQKGDEILRHVAKILKSVVGSSGICARYGGEEFGVILPGTDLKSAQEIGEKIRVAMQNESFEGAQMLPQGKLTVSIGIAGFPQNAENKEKLIQKADEALYKAKFVSKNRVEVYYSVFDELRSSLKDDEKELFNSIQVFIMLVNAKDKYTYGHCLRTMELSKKMAIFLGLDHNMVKDITYGSLLHDIGKIEVSRDILNKPSRLSQEEWEIVKQHPQWGADIIKPMDSLKGALPIILRHHENYDGSGYPHGLKGNEIDIGARILRIIDSFDAMTTNRPYRAAMSCLQAAEELKKKSGIYYDPELVEQFIKMMETN